MADRGIEESRAQLMAELAALTRRERLQYLMQSAFRNYDADERGGRTFRRLLDAARARIDDDSFTPARPRVRQ
ncbi:MAG: hypothetical protein JWN93_1221 [Hyphomicrobiales bacterium]|nr:hypothetical protein [Hyphomicrobiales bacterium]